MKMFYTLLVCSILVLSQSLYSQTSVGQKYDSGIYPNDPRAPFLVPTSDETEYNSAAQLLSCNNNNIFLYPNAYDNMTILSSPSYSVTLDGYLTANVETPAFQFNITELASGRTKLLNINIIQKGKDNNLGVVNELSTSRQLVTVSMPVQVNNGDYVSTYLTDGYFIMKKFNSAGAQKYIIRINGDGIVMFQGTITNNSVNYDFNFYPGYYAKSDTIKSVEAPPRYIKKGISALYLDNYGGFGTYLFPSDNSTSTVAPVIAENASGTYPSMALSYHNDDILWIAPCPPKKLKTEDLQKKVIANAGMKDNNETYAPYYNRVFPYDEITPPGKIYDSLHNGINPDIFIFGQAWSMYSSSASNNWHNSYVLNPNNISALIGLLPYYSNNSNKYKSLGSICIYTSPGMFLKNTRFIGALNNYYGDGSFFPSGYTIDTNPIRTVTHIPLYFTTTDYWNGEGSATNQWPGHLDHPGNPFGANMNDYVSQLVNFYGQSNPLNPLLYAYRDQINFYLDWYYYYNIPKSYMLARELRQALPDKILFAHTHTLPGGDAYLPQTDSYFSYILRGESGNRSYNDFTYLRYYCSGYNISNTPALFLEDNKPDTNELFFGDHFPVGDFKYANLGYEFRFPYMVANAFNQNAANTGELLKYANERRDNIISYYDNTLGKSDLTSFYASQNAKYQEQYNKISRENNLLSNNDQFVSGDFNNDGVKDILRIASDGSLYVSKGLPSSINYFMERETNWGQITGFNSYLNVAPYVRDRVLVGHFTDPNKTEILHVKFVPWSTNGGYTWTVYTVAKDIDANSIPKPCSEHFVNTGITTNCYWDDVDQIFAADLDGDGYTDIIKAAYSANQINVSLNKQDPNSPSISARKFSIWGCWTDASYLKTPWDWQDGANTKLFVSDLNGDGYADILRVSNSGNISISKNNYNGAYRYGFLQPSPSNVNITNYDQPKHLYFSPKLFISGKNALPTLIYYREPGLLEGYYVLDSTLSTIPQLFGAKDDNSTSDAKVIDTTQTVLLNDFSGDGLNDICILTPGSPNVGIGLYDSPANKFSWITEWHKKNGHTFQKGGINPSAKDYSYSLEQNYPNPFNPSTRIQYSIKIQSKVSIKVFDILGREVKTLVNEVKEPGQYEIEFNAKNLSSGIYFYRIQTDTFVKTQKMILMK